MLCIQVSLLACHTVTCRYGICYTHLYCDKYTLPFSELLLHAQVITDFIEAHPHRKITKKWLHAKLKDIAQREKGCWVINPQALAQAGVVAL